MRQLASHSEKGINRNSLPFKLYEKAKKFGTWDPRDIDFSQDKEDWESLTYAQREELMQLISQFYGAEESVTIDILPMISAISKVGYFEEEMYLTTFVFEEAKHADFFSLFLENIGVKGELGHIPIPAWHKLFHQILPETMDRLNHDQSPHALIDAAVTYNMFAEGVMAETGYYYFYECLKSINKMPGLLEGIGNIKRDESRHIGFGTFLIQRLISEDPSLYDYAIEKLNHLMGTIRVEFGEQRKFGAFDPTIDERLTQFGNKQYQARVDVLARAKNRKFEEIYNLSEKEVGVE
ncbi:R2-like ligand-binding oxidase [Bacillus dakarensis]|uniref:R2-like ligand-binding oxidase n=1 Tax=Robertmurraya dakarensis TaxID=1926278 RepID=UPI0009826715|nr:R2-like ligand-binding oxidase [Bacillus dakarensis]